MKNLIILILSVCPLLVVAQGSYEPTNPCEDLTRIIKMFENNTLSDLVKPGTEAESSYSKFIIESEPKVLPKNFTSGTISHQTVFDLWNLHFYAKELEINQASQYYNDIKNCFSGWTKTEKVEEFEEDLGFDFGDDGTVYYYGYSEAYTLYLYEYVNKANTIKIRIEVSVYEDYSQMYMNISKIME
jgi:hypothetical protein